MELDITEDEMSNLKRISRTEKTEGKWIKGTDIFEDGSKVNWIRMKDELYENRIKWISGSPVQIFDQYNWKYVDEKQIKDLISVCDDNLIDLVYFLYAFSGKNSEYSSTCINWILGPIAEWMQRNNKTFSEFRFKKSPLELKNFYEKTVLSKGFIKSKSKEALTFWIDDLELIKSNFWVDETIDLDSIVQDVFQKNYDKIMNGNLDKIGNWVVGQVMKETKGSVDPSLVKEKVFVQIDSLKGKL